MTSFRRYRNETPFVGISLLASYGVTYLLEHRPLTPSALDTPVLVSLLWWTLGDLNS